jgi:hypothetical protein
VSEFSVRTLRWEVIFRNIRQKVLVAVEVLLGKGV